MMALFALLGSFSGVMEISSFDNPLVIKENPVLHMELFPLFFEIALAEIP